MAFTYKYARPALAVDCAVFGFNEKELKVLLIQRDLEPFAGHWALPGGFVEVGETLDNAARRELEEETGLQKVFLEQLYSFGSPDRDPREHVVSVAYYALVRLSDHKAQAATDARDARWYGIGELPKLVFDHDKILKLAYERLKSKVRYQPIGFELLPKKFTLTQLQNMYEVILDRELDKRNFRKKILAMEILVDLDQVETDTAHRPARLYRFDKKSYQRLEKQGFNFEV
ncbi:MAG: NUDIX domain-containing protein [Mariniblastus sp.]